MPRPRNKRPVSIKVYFSDYDQLWHGYITVGVKPNGKPDVRHRTGHTRDECEDKIRALEDEKAAGTIAKAGRVPTVKTWLTHWCELIARPSVSYSTYANSYAYSIYNYLIPELGAHRLDHLEPEHLEAMYQRLLGTERAPGLSPGTVGLIHRTLRAALNEAVKRGKCAKNPALIARSPESEAEEITPLTSEESRRLLDAIVHRRNGARWLLAMIGLRQGEVLGLRWSDVDLDTGIVTIRGQAQRRKWQHGCDDPARCARWKHGCTPSARCGLDAWRCPRREVRCRVKPCPPAWQHGCADRQVCKATQGRACPRREVAHCPRHRGVCPQLCKDPCTQHAAVCPQRTGGGVVIDDGDERAEKRRKSRRRIRTKSKAGTRKLALPPQVLVEVREHRKRQLEERIHAADLWRDLDLVFAGVTGGPIDARRDWGDWKGLLEDAGVRDVRLHDARHAAATLLLAKGVDRRVVMDIMGWSSERMLTRYQHVVDEMRQEAARRLGDALWDSSATDLATTAETKTATPKGGPRNRRLKAV